MTVRFDVAISLAGPDRATAREIRDALKLQGLTVFFAEDYEHEMLGKSGHRVCRSRLSGRSLGGSD